MDSSGTFANKSVEGLGKERRVQLCHHLLQEMITRAEPFECEPMLLDPSTMSTSKGSLGPEEILNLIRMDLDPPFRPFLPHGNGDVPPELQNRIGKCWRESASERPTFANIKLMLKRLSKSFGCRNLLDNLLQRMERYTENLEQMVQEKTASLEEEKKRSDDLLNELLPK